MLSRTVAVFFVLVLSTPITAFSQNESKSAESLIARISYSRDGVVDWRDQEGSPQVCFAVYRDGYYRISKLAEEGKQNLEGFLTSTQLASLNRLLHKVDFQSYGDGIRLKDAESLIVEVARHDDTKRYTWVDADHRNPFPKSAKRVVNWLEGFKAQGAIPFTFHEMSDVPICPPATTKPLSPQIAGLQGALST